MLNHVVKRLLRRGEVSRAGADVSRMDEKHLWSLDCFLLTCSFSSWDENEQYQKFISFCRIHSRSGFCSYRIWQDIRKSSLPIAKRYVLCIWSVNFQVYMVLPSFLYAWPQSHFWDTKKTKPTN
jgi:hypothetical protein